MPSEIEREIEKLKMKKVELANRINLTRDFEEREELQREIDRIQAQIEILEKFNK